MFGRLATGMGFANVRAATRVLMLVLVQALGGNEALTAPYCATDTHGLAKSSAEANSGACSGAGKTWITPTWYLSTLKHYVETEGASRLLDPPAPKPCWQWVARVPLPVALAVQCALPAPPASEVSPTVYTQLSLSSAHGIPALPSTPTQCVDRAPPPTRGHCFAPRDQYSSKYLGPRWRRAGPQHLLCFLSSRRPSHRAQTPWTTCSAARASCSATSAGLG